MTLRVNSASVFVGVVAVALSIMAYWIVVRGAPANHVMAAAMGILGPIAFVGIVLRYVWSILAD